MIKSAPALERPLIIGLTGSIGMGKSTVAAMMMADGVPVFDADAEVRRLQGPDGALLPAIEKAFPGTTGPEGVDRSKLGALVFGDAAALAKLEKIVHPAVAKLRMDFVDRYSNESLICFDIPLLFEKGGAEQVDTVVVVSAPYEIQRARVLARLDMTEQKFDEIVALQTPDAEKRARADHVIDTSLSLTETKAQVRRILSCLRSKGVA